MKNIITGYVTTALGFVIMVLDILFYFGIVKFPEAMPANKPLEVLLAFILGLALFIMPKTWLEEKINDLYNKKVK
jgi:hypothetical protein